MDTTMHLTNLVDQPANVCDGLVNPTLLATTNPSRKRTRSNSMSISDHAQKNVRLLSPPRFRPAYTVTNLSASPPCSFNDTLLTRQNTLEDLSSKAEPLLDIRESDSMDWDMPFISEHDMDTKSQELSLSLQKSAQRQRQTQLPYTMGYRADCEKCRLGVPGHFAHILSRE